MREHVVLHGGHRSADDDAARGSCSREKRIRGLWEGNGNLERERERERGGGGKGREMKEKLDGNDDDDGKRERKLGEKWISVGPILTAFCIYYGDGRGQRFESIEAIHLLAQFLEKMLSNH